MCHLPNNVNDMFSINGLTNIINKPTYFDSRTGNSSLLDTILITDNVPLIDSDTIHIDRKISDHDGTCVTIRDRPFNLKGGGGVMVFCFVQKKIFGQHKS